MQQCRKKPIPLIYTYLSFVRRKNASVIADCPDDLDMLEAIQSVARGETCLSTLENPHEFLVKAKFPSDILEKSGQTDDLVEWYSWGWKTWDVESLVVHKELPSEAIALVEAHISRSSLELLAGPSSCIPLLEECERNLTNGSYKGYRFSNHVRQLIGEFERI